MEKKPLVPHKAFARYEINGATQTQEVTVDAENGWHAMVLQKKFHLPSGAKIIAQSASKIR